MAENLIGEWLVAAAGPLVEQSQRHDEGEVRGWVVPAHRLHGRGALRRLERHAHFVGRHVLQDLEQVIRVEADIQRFALVRDRDLLLGFAEVWRGH